MTVIREKWTSPNIKLANLVNMKIDQLSHTNEMIKKTDCMSS